MFDLDQKNAWGKVTGNDPLGLKRDALQNSLTSTSLFDMDLTNDMSALEREQLKSMTSSGGKLDLMKFGFSSFDDKSQSNGSASYIGSSVNQAQEASLDGLDEGLTFETYIEEDDYLLDEPIEEKVKLHTESLYKKIDSHNIFRFNPRVESFYRPDVDSADFVYDDF